VDFGLRIEETESYGLLLGPRGRRPAGARDRRSRLCGCVEVIKNRAVSASRWERPLRLGSVLTALRAAASSRCRDVSWSREICDVLQDHLYSTSSGDGSQYAKFEKSWATQLVTPRRDGDLRGAANLARGREVAFSTPTQGTSVGMAPRCAQRKSPRF
jgi:hypothetical protein